MPYATGILKDRVKILTRKEATEGRFGRVGGGYEVALTVWANVTWNKGVKAMREGALDAYDVIMVRCRWNNKLTRESRIEYNGTTYQIDSYHADKHANTIQCTCTELTGNL